MMYLRGVSTLQYDSAKCSGCGYCAAVCPQRVFVMKGGKAGVIDRDLCMECGACMRNCVSGAIKVRSGVGCAAALINGMLTGDASCGCSDGGSTPCCG